jgi:hypothetical protein
MNDWISKSVDKSDETSITSVMKKKNPYLVKGRYIAKLLSIVILASIPLLYLASIKLKGLPEFGKIEPSLKSEPVQLETKDSPFSFEYRGTKYVVHPQANYEIKGLIVSHNDITAWWDMYHTKDSVDIKDLCLVWGENISTNIYQKVKFYNESVSCHFTMKTFEEQQLFNINQVSNNHLLSSNEVVREKIRSMAVGDQIYLRGMLVNYHPEGYPDYLRRSSLTRKDTGGGACEVFFVEDAQIIKKASRAWLITYNTASAVLFYSLITRIIMFLLMPWLEYKFE